MAEIRHIQNREILLSQRKIISWRWKLVHKYRIRTR